MPYAANPPVITVTFAKMLSDLSGIVRHIAARSILHYILASCLLATAGFVNLAMAGNAPLVLYTFNEGLGSTVNDVSGTGQPLNLTIANPTAVTWNVNGSLRINAATMIASSTAATKINYALKASNAFTIEAWVQPANTTQNGPARILTLSKDAHNRNITLGQEEISYIGRLRTTKTNANGTPQISTPAGTLNTDLTHVVYSRDTSGKVKLFINGVKQERTTIDGNFSNWDNTYRLALGNELNGGRPWLGTYHQLAIYDYAFSGTEVGQAYAAGSTVPVNTTTTMHADSVPVARNDSASTSNDSGVMIQPLANDSGLADTPISLSIIKGPSRGQVYVVGSLIWYLPTQSDFTGTDNFTYQIMDADGDRATATVSINLSCWKCTDQTNKSFNLSWNASAGTALGYYVYYGATASTITTFASTVPGTSTTYTTSSKNLNLQAGEQVCFRVRAYNTVGVSAFSSAVCRIL
ncbi:MAG: fibronectin type III domain-containing protein [Gammaproteobacteria bacterium]|nr:fibronectin type III domain-containing protein [Gammaproteobacteria bacterium]